MQNETKTFLESLERISKIIDTVLFEDEGFKLRAESIKRNLGGTILEKKPINDRIYDATNELATPTANDIKLLIILVTFLCNNFF